MTRRNSASPRPARSYQEASGVAVKRIREFRDFSKDVKPGDIVDDVVRAGDFIDAIGVVKAAVLKAW